MNAPDAPGRHARSAITLIALMVGITGIVEADSIFSSVGFGRWNYPVDARSAGMGDVSVVAPSEWGFSPRNPALAASLGEPAIYISVGADFTSVDSGEDSPSRADARLPLIAVGLPIVAGVVGKIHVHDLNDARYDISQKIAGDPGYTLISSGEGAWSQVALTLARRIGTGAVGLQIGLPISSFADEVTRDFSATGYSDRSSRTETALEDAMLISLGGHYELGAFGAGGYVQLPSDGEVVTQLELRGGDDEYDRSDYDIRLPASAGAGVSFRLTDRVLVSGEWRHDGWESTEFNGENWLDVAEELGITREFRNVDAWGVGVEWRRGREDHRSAWKRLRLRAGFSYQPWATAGPSFGEITDKSVTAGVGVPFVAGNGEIGLAVRYTQRRESGSDAEENILSLVFGMSFAKQPRAY